MKKVIEGMPNTYIDQFDYSGAATQWVNNTQIGSALAKRIVCLAQSSRAEGGLGKVVVVAHSMGGLATRYASSLTIGGARVADGLGLVVTLSTPNTGSFLLSGGTRERGVARYLEVWCQIYNVADHGQVTDTCLFLSAAHSPAATAMVPGSAELKMLPAWPTGLPVLTVAGHVGGIDVHPFGLHLHMATNSDLVVSVDSARRGGSHAEKGGGVATINCESWEFPHALPSCWHGGEESDHAIQALVVKAIRTYRSSQLEEILCPRPAGRCLGTQTGDIDGNGRADDMGLTVSGTDYGKGVLAVHAVLDDGQIVEQTLVNDAYPLLANWLGLSDVNGDHHLDLFVVPTGGVHDVQVLVFEFRYGKFEPLRGNVGDALYLDGAYAFYDGFSCRTVDGHRQLVQWGATLDSNPPGSYQADETVYQATSTGVMVRLESHHLIYPAASYVGGNYSPPKAVFDRAGAHCTGLVVFPKE